MRNARHVATESGELPSTGYESIVQPTGIEIPFLRVGIQTRLLLPGLSLLYRFTTNKRSAKLLGLILNQD